MGPYYKKLAAEHTGLLPLDAALAAELDAKNTEELKKLDARIEDAEQNLGETDIADACTAKALYLAQIGEKVGISMPGSPGLSMKYAFLTRQVAFRIRLFRHTGLRTKRPRRWGRASTSCLRSSGSVSFSATTTLLPAISKS